MKVFLSAAITSGRREYVEAVRAIAQALQDEGVEVLNQRVADPTFPQPSVDRARALREVYQWLQEADALVAEATISSTGVGCELTTVQMRGKPVLLLYDAHFGFRISDWVLHHPDPKVTARPYRDLPELVEEVRRFVRGLRGAASG
ncbi:MAG: hypothetical protein NZ695_09275 [Dehalococcoidia bacterium]|jgi:uncharacterized protein (UPF0210 family)|nr:hypothetical protein [Dehalococcoidia bacterium]MDW8008986.1 hypothetical protein [Chloroflexota bacterium]